ncbi:uncharacterized protein ATNIH1004_002984 [Aspergillus tanneri]|uniref:Uncharacterized protein n=1 Tax=Aspergillus tanneri TaxID=1220188 RepID=A0A5M9MT31_9EURO|nr:uncharacterized protein ATNIH1004_002984 [Aspergillus tanneri]KAA8650301.1 hypothetical protein ATNIH1004_002984 [Aspergillus tanneri]
MKGVDVNITAYYSELAFLSHSITGHIQTAEMDNQPVNSLALISARYSAQAVEILSMMSAAYLYLVCQALDLRALHEEFILEEKEKCLKMFLQLFSSFYHCSQDAMQDAEKIWHSLEARWRQKNCMDLSDKCECVARESLSDIVSTVQVPQEADMGLIWTLTQTWENKIAYEMMETYSSVRKSFFENQSTPKFLAGATSRMYYHIRSELQIPFHRGLIDHPTFCYPARDRANGTIGGHIAKIYGSVRDGTIMTPLKEFLNNRGHPQA